MALKGLIKKKKKTYFVTIHYFHFFIDLFCYTYKSAEDAELTIGDVASLIQPQQQEWKLVSSEDEDDEVEFI